MKIKYIAAVVALVGLGLQQAKADFISSSASTTLTPRAFRSLASWRQHSRIGENNSLRSNRSQCARAFVEEQQKVEQQDRKIEQQEATINRTEIYRGAAAERN
jgi:hypothetical protein